MDAIDRPPQRCHPDQHLICYCFWSIVFHRLFVALSRCLLSLDLACFHFGFACLTKFEPLVIRICPYLLIEVTACGRPWTSSPIPLRVPSESFMATGASFHYFQSLPVEIQQRILKAIGGGGTYGSIRDLLATAATCHSLYELSKSNAVWRHVGKKLFIPPSIDIKR